MAYNRIAGIGKITTTFTIDDPTVILTMDNIVEICATMSGVTRTTSNNFIMSMPDTIPKPSKLIYFNAIYVENSTYKTGIFLFNTNGRIYTTQALTNATIYFSSAFINLNSNFYSNAIGNNDESTMTSPIMWK